MLSIMRVIFKWLNEMSWIGLNLLGAEVRPVDLQSVTGGIIHTKLWVVDRKHLYIGSANMDWRSLTQVFAVTMHGCLPDMQ